MVTDRAPAADLRRVPAGRGACAGGSRSGRAPRSPGYRPRRLAGGRADRPADRRGAAGRLRHGGVHRRLDPRPRAGPAGGPGHGRRDARARRWTRRWRPRRPGVFAAGNLVHAAETADVAALSGRHAARQIAAMLGRGRPAPAGGPAVPVLVEAPLAWISPSAVTGSGHAAAARPVRAARHRVPAAGPADGDQDGRLLATARVGLRPARSLTLPAAWLSRVDPPAARSASAYSHQPDRQDVALDIHAAVSSYI